MSRYSTYTDRDTAPSQDGGRGWRGVNLEDAPMLTEGLAAAAVNCRFSGGRPATRKGIGLLRWANRLDDVDSSLVLPYGQAQGCARFTDPVTGLEWLVVVADGMTYRTRPGMQPVEISLPEGESIVGAVQLAQAFDTLLMQRGEDVDRLVLRSFTEGWRPITDATSSEMDDPGTDPLPNSSTALEFSNRVWVPHDRDLVSVSDFLDYTVYDAATQTFRINRGTDDSLVALYKFNDTTILAFKERSVYALLNLVPDTNLRYSDAILDEITREYGAVSAKAIVAVGDDVWFLSDHRGIVSIIQTEQNKLHGVDVPKSRSIDPLVRQINWSYASAATAAYWDNKVYFAVPVGNPICSGPETAMPATHTGASFTRTVVAGRRYLWTPGDNETKLDNGSASYTDETEFVAEGSTVTIYGSAGTAVTCTLQEVYRGFCNRVLVYDTMTQEWSGYDESDSIQILDWIKVTWGGKTRLAFLSVDGFVYLYEYGHRDQVGGQDGVVSSSEIATRLLTRGYDCKATGRKRWRMMEASYRGWGELRATITQRLDGVSETRSVATISKSRTTYDRPFDAENWDPTNVDDDWDTPYRQDYSVVPDGLVLGAGVCPGKFQQFGGERHKLRGQGQYVQLEINTTQGRIVVDELLVRAQPGQTRMGGIA